MNVGRLIGNKKSFGLNSLLRILDPLKKDELPSGCGMAIVPRMQPEGSFIWKYLEYRMIGISDGIEAIRSLEIADGCGI